MGSAWSQSFPPAATFTEKNCPDQTGKVFIVTGSSTGVGKELAEILYSHNAKVYVAARSQDKATTAIESMKTAFPKSKGELVFLHLDLDDLTTIKKSAEDFLSKEKKLDVLWNNAGVMFPPQGSKTKQGYELQLGTNNVAPFLFTKLLTPILVSTAKASPPGAVRVVWVSSSMAEQTSPTNGVDMANLDYKSDKNTYHKYGLSKAGNILHSKEYAKRYGGDGIISVSLNPGNLKTPLQRYLPAWQKLLFDWALHNPIQGAYTELFAGLAPEVPNGAWIVPWGRYMPLRKDIDVADKTEAEGGNGTAMKFWDWTDEQIKPYQ